jgi:CheY-like chemotaxis protein
VLREAGHDVATAREGQHPLALIRASAPDLLITDIYMPGTDGIEVLLELRGSCPDLPIVAMSTGATDVRIDQLTAAKLLGAAAVLEKPFSAGELLRLVDRILRDPVLGRARVEEDAS